MIHGVCVCVCACVCVCVCVHCMCDISILTLPFLYLSLSDLVQLAQTCASRGECESSLKLISAIFRLPSQGPQLHQSLVRTANVTFHHMIEAQQPIHMILDNLKKMTMMECVSDWIWEKLLYYAYQCTDNKAIVEIVREMHAKVDCCLSSYLVHVCYNFSVCLVGS